MDGRIRVLHVITRLDPGGSAENTVLSVERVDPDRFDSYVWTGPGLHGGGPPEPYARRLHGRITVLPRLVRPIRPLKDLLAVFELTARLRRDPPGILHLHSAKAGALGRIAARLARYRGKTIYTPHGHIFSGYGGPLACRVFTFIEKWLAPQCDAIVGLTGDEVRQFLAHGAGQPGQFTVIPSGVEIDPFEAAVSARNRVRKQFGFSRKTPLIGFFGRFAPVKGPDQFIEVAARILRQVPKLRVLMVGDGPMLHALKRRAGELHLDEIITWTGWRSDIPELVAALDLLLNTSRNEGQGRVVVEAAAAGVPTVALANGGIGEVVVAGETGLLADHDDLEALADAAVRLLLDPRWRQRMGEAARKRAREKFSVEVMIAKLEELYTALASPTL